MNKNENIKLLVVEDDEITRENSVEFLENFFEKIYEAKDGLSALKIYNEINPDIVISDIQMPRLNGLKFIEQIRLKNKKTQIIVLSAYSNKEYLFKAIELQLVKYLTKPINEHELKEALFSCIKNIEDETSNIYQLAKNITFDTYNHSLKIDEEIIKLRVKEAKLLTLFLKNQTRYVTYEEIENFVWSDSVMSKDALKSLVKTLKQKLSNVTISNLSGIGYKIEL